MTTIEMWAELPILALTILGLWASVEMLTLQVLGFLDEILATTRDRSAEKRATYLVRIGAEPVARDAPGDVRIVRLAGVPGAAEVRGCTDGAQVFSGALSGSPGREAA